MVLAAASQFHGKTDDVLENGTVHPKMAGAYHSVTDLRLSSENADFQTLSEAEKQALRDGLPDSDKRLAAMLANRDAFNLANALQPFTGQVFAQVVFGIGVLGMALSTIIILMLISGFTFCEMLNVPSEGWPHRLGCLIPGIVGLFFPSSGPENPRWLWRFPPPSSSAPCYPSPTSPSFS